MARIYGFFVAMALVSLEAMAFATGLSALSCLSELRISKLDKLHIHASFRCSVSV